MKIPFNVYDFFAYLASGLVVGVAADAVLGERWSLASEVSPAALGLLIVAAYVLGHVVAQLSALVLEAGMVRLVLGPPSENLMAEKSPRILGLCFPGYFKPLPKSTRDRLIRRAADAELPSSGEPLFLHAFAIVSKDAAQRERLDAFRNLYGFARNMSVACFLVAGILMWGDEAASTAGPGWLPWVVLGAAIILLYRYLKFFRLYTYHLLVVFSEWSGEA